MQTTINAIIKGAGYFDGLVEGKQYNSGQIFIEEPFDSTKPNYKGFRTVEYKCSSDATVKPIMDMNFPVSAQVTLELSATKRESSIVVVGIKVTGAAHPQPKA